MSHTFHMSCMCRRAACAYPNCQHGPRLDLPRPMGCICPPTSEQTCQNPLCLRKPLPSAGGTIR